MSMTPLKNHKLWSGSIEDLKRKRSRLRSKASRCKSLLADNQEALSHQIFVDELKRTKACDYCTVIEDESGYSYEFEYGGMSLIFEKSDYGWWYRSFGDKRRIYPSYDEVGPTSYQQLHDLASMCITIITEFFSGVDLMYKLQDTFPGVFVTKYSSLVLEHGCLSFEYSLGNDVMINVKFCDNYIGDINLFATMDDALALSNVAENPTPSSVSKEAWFVGCTATVSTRANPLRLATFYNGSLKMLVPDINHIYESHKYLADPDISVGIVLYEKDYTFVILHEGSLKKIKRMLKDDDKLVGEYQGFTSKLDDAGVNHEDWHAQILARSFNLEENKTTT